MGRCDTDNANPQRGFRMKHGHDQLCHLFFQGSDPNWAQSPEQRFPTRWWSRVNRNGLVRRKREFDRVIWRKPSGSTVHDQLCLVNQCLHSSPLYLRTTGWALHLRFQKLLVTAESLSPMVQARKYLEIWSILRQRQSISSCPTKQTFYLPWPAFCDSGRDRRDIFCHHD